MSRFVLGDLHGQYDALVDVLTQAEFDYDKDKLILLGDLVDGGKKPKECIDELLKIKNLVYIYGNHCLWLKDYINNQDTKELWVQQGGKVTLESYGAKLKGASYAFDQRRLFKRPTIPQSHKDFFNSGVYYHLEDGMAFVHGGFSPNVHITEQPFSYLVWDRQLIDYARNHIVEGYKKVFVGHSTTICHGTDKPLKLNNLWMLDTGAGHLGKLSLMNIDTEEYWQSVNQESAR